MMFKELKLKDHAAFAVMVGIGYLFAVTQRYFIPELIIVRTLGLLIVSITPTTIFFFIVKPAYPAALSKTGTARYQFPFILPISGKSTAASTWQRLSPGISITSTSTSHSSSGVVLPNQIEVKLEKRPYTDSTGSNGFSSIII